MDKLNLEPLLWVLLGMMLMYIIERNTPKKGSKHFGYLMTGIFLLFIFMLIYEIGLVSLLYEFAFTRMN